jgi:L-serine dehydratase
MVAANDFIRLVADRNLPQPGSEKVFVRCTLKGSLAFTGKGHSTDRAVALGLHGHLPANLVDKDVAGLVQLIWESDRIKINKGSCILFNPDEHITFDKGDPLPEHPNGMIFDLIGLNNKGG